MKVIFNSYLLSSTKVKSIDLDFTGTFKELFDMLCIMYGPEFESLILTDGKLSTKAIVLVNDSFLNKETAFSEYIENDDTVTFLPIIAGG